MPTCDVKFGFAKPSLTHLAIAHLVKVGRVDYVASQNVDGEDRCTNETAEMAWTSALTETERIYRTLAGIHARTGIDKEKLAELHGNCFSERCEKCNKVHLRDFEMRTVGFKYTRRKCDACGGRLTDNILDWENALPDDELDATIHHTEQADLVVCMGTSLRITPVCDLPEQVQANGGKLVIVNLQATPKDERADLVIHAKCDQVMAQLLKHMEIKVPPYVRVDKARISYHVLFPTPPHRKQFSHGVRGSGIKLIFSSVHHPKCPLPFVRSLSVELEGENRIIETTNQLPLVATFHRKVYAHEVLVFRIRVHHVEQVGMETSSIEYTVRCSDISSNLLAGEDGGRECEFVSQAYTPPILYQSGLDEDYVAGAVLGHESTNTKRRMEFT
mmetsp:Transcript_8363/g.52213  ORF Transcript_8363/g.52213 Transcript_8363/m.52213 type:complete len:388 (+) Transcript_8363:547-1710(+)